MRPPKKKEKKKKKTERWSQFYSWPLGHELMHLSPKSHLHHIYSNNFRNTTQDLSADV